MDQNNAIMLNDDMNMHDHTVEQPHGLRGHVQIFRHNKKTNETSLWYEGDNIVTLTGYQFILMKMFDLYLDSSHGKSYDRVDKDTNLATPDLNESTSSSGGGMGIGVEPASYTPMADNIAVNHFVQGFMVGNGGAGEDTITSKNTNYSFKMLRNPIPFQQTQAQSGLPADLDGKYCGVYRTSTSTKSYFIKKFEETPHIYHSWWVDGQRWDERQPVTKEQLGPNAIEGTDLTKRIETYAECKLRIDEGDFVSYFNNNNTGQTTAMINELGLVAFDLTDGTRSVLETLYQRKIKDLLFLVFDKSKDSASAAIKNEHVAQVQELANEIYDVLNPALSIQTQHNIDNFKDVVYALRVAEFNQYQTYRNRLSSADCIGVEALYNQDGTLVYTTDQFLTHLAKITFSDSAEAQRIKLITYYTFNSIPIESNMELLINYRLYAN
jgi:hypothetical protein